MDLGGFDGFGGTPFLPQIHPESPGNGISNIPDLKIFWGSMLDPPLLVVPLALTNSNLSSQNPGSTPGVTCK